MASVSSYQDVRTKTVNWCNKLLKNGVLNNEQFNTCISGMNSGDTSILPPVFQVPRTGVSYNYGLYDKEATDIASKINDTNTDVNFITNSKGTYLAETVNGTIYFISNINGDNTNQSDLSWTLLQQNDQQQYAILSPHGHYLTANDDYSVTSNSSVIGPSTMWSLTRIDSNIIAESVLYRNYYLSYNVNDDKIELIYDKNEHSAWTLYPQETINTESGSMTGNVNYNSRKTQLLIRIQDTEMRLLFLRTVIESLSYLRNDIAEKYSRGFNYVSSILQMQPNVSDVNNNLVEDKIIQARNMKLSELDKQIKAYNDQIAQIEANDYTQITREYNSFITELESVASNSSAVIQTNSTIIDRQNATYDKYNSEYSSRDSKLNKYLDDDNTMRLNMEMLTSFVKSNTTYSYLYPVFIFILFAISIYLIYLAYQKFKTNIQQQYK
jgi:hypothetical protein